MRRKGWGLVAVLLCAVRAEAYTVDDVLVDSWAGSGSNEVLLVVDFWPDNGQDDSFGFGYRFDQASITGLDLLDALDAAGNGLTYAEDGGFVTDFWYDDGTTVHHTGYSWPDSWWSYWTSDDYGEAWVSPLVGPGDRVLVGGDTDGWFAKPGDDFETPPTTPLVPEPGTLSILLLGAAALRRRR